MPLTLTLPTTDPDARTAGPGYAQMIIAALKEIASASPTTPQAHGAPCDGVNSDYAGFQAALDSGGGVYLPEARYLTTTTPVVPAGTPWVLGAGQTLAVIEAQGCDGLAFAGDSVAYEPRAIRDFGINGTSCGAKSGIVSLGTADPANKLQRVLFEKLAVGNFGTGMRFRNLWFSEIASVTLFPVNVGVALVGQCIQTRCNAMHVEYGAVAGSSGTACGFLLDAASDYTGATSHNPEQVWITRGTATYGFSRGVWAKRADAVHVIEADLSNCLDYGMEVDDVRISLTARDVYIDAPSNPDFYGVRLNPLGGSVRCKSLFSHVSVAQNGTGGHGISIETNRCADVEYCDIQTTIVDAIHFNGTVEFSSVRSNGVHESAQLITVQNLAADGVVLLDGNFPDNSVTLASNAGKVVWRQYYGTGSQFIKEIVNGTTVFEWNETGLKVDAAFSVWGRAFGYGTQPVLATGAGHTVDDVITLLQNYGFCKQS